MEIFFGLSDHILNSASDFNSFLILKFEALFAVWFVVT
jgi:hypothetical protein